MTLLDELAWLKSENVRLQRLLNNARAKSKARGLDLLRQEADEVQWHFTPQWEPLREVAMRAGVKSAAWLASRARDLQARGFVESKWIGTERTQFKLWRLKGRPVPVHASGLSREYLERTAALRARSTQEGDTRNDTE